ncbi:acyl-CoA synthetase [Amaricoccus sp.]|uniref:acyl-CoA synthetase n=1 Tax=Amaricoccus sp. TaxID=1872485 RepID=UPI0039E43C17
MRIATSDDIRAIEAEMPWPARLGAATLYTQLLETAGRVPRRPALTFQLQGGPDDKAVTLDWATVRADVTRAANLFRRLGVGDADTVAFVLPNGIEAAVMLLAGATAGVVMPVNPLLAPEHIAHLLREAGAQVVVTLAPFPKSDLSDRVAEAVSLAPEVRVVLEVDLRQYLPWPLQLVVPLIRPRRRVRHHARIADFRAALSRERADALDFAETGGDRVCARFHTGGTTGLPKLAQHRAGGILYNGWCGASYAFGEEDVLMCPLPLFHVLAAYPIFMACLVSGACLVLPTPQGYRGEGVFDSFWKLIERHRATFMVAVPTAVAALMQRKVDADVSSLRLAICGSSAMPVELFRRFEAAAGVTVIEGYGMTEATCLVAVNPPYGERRIGSVGLPVPYTEVRILHCDGDGRILRSCDVEEVGEICVRAPGVHAEVYAEPRLNRGMMAEGGFLRTGDLGRLDAAGYLWITGRAKDLIIRGGHNIDPAMIEDALMQHPDVAFAGAIGQPDARSGEVPAVYVELVAGRSVSPEALTAHVRERVAEPAAVPKHLEIMPALPKTAVGKIFKPDLRRMAIGRVLDAALIAADSGARVAEVVEDRRRGLVARIRPGTAGPDDPAATAALAGFAVTWEWTGPHGG